MIGYRGYEFSRFLGPLLSLEPETQRSTNFTIFVAQIDSFQVIGVMTSNAGGMISGDFKNCIYFWHHHGIEVVPHSADAQNTMRFVFRSALRLTAGKILCIGPYATLSLPEYVGNPSKACRCWPLNAQSGLKCLRRGQGVRGVIKSQEVIRDSVRN